MIPTLTNVYDKTRAVLGEHNISGGEAFTDTVLSNYVDTALRKLYAVMSIYDNTGIERTTHYVLEANVGVWLPSMSGVSDFGEPRHVRLASKETASYSIDSVVLTSSQTTLNLGTAAADILAGDRVIIYGAAGLKNGNINDEWTVTSKPNPDDVRIVGLIEGDDAGDYTGSSGTLVKPGSWSQSLTRVEDIGRYTNNTGVYEWYKDSIRIPPAAEARVLQVEYTSSGAVPAAVGDSVGIDGSLDFLAYYTAYLASSALGAERAASVLLMQAVGADMTDDGRGGFLGDLISQGIDTLQQREDIWPRFKRRRGKDILYY